MKKSLFLILALVVSSAVIFSSCKKDKKDKLQEPQVTVIQNQTDLNAGLGDNPGHPAGYQFELPSYVTICGDIRGGIQGKVELQDKNFKGPFIGQQYKNWIDYGTGTYVNLYVKFYNSLATPATLTLPGGLIFVDSADYFNRDPVYQKGLILQAVHIQLPAMDTAFARLRAYCLNHSLAGSNYQSVYFIGPVTICPDLVQICSIMAPKQYPFGHEYDIQQIIWNVTDNGLTITPQEVAFLNGLP